MANGSGTEDVRALVVGCGALGSRHLQAVASLPQVSEIDVVDPRPEALQLGRERLAEVRGAAERIDARWCASLDEARRGGALCIVATQAQGRGQLVREASETLGYATFLLEKILATSMQELDELAELARARELAVWVNCQTRAYPFHQRVKRRIESAKQRLNQDVPIYLNVAGGNLGLATNGIHNADLFAFYDGADRIESAGSHVDPVVHQTSRGQSDLSGTLQAYTEKGSRFTLAYAGDHDRSEQLSISSRDYRCIVDHNQRWAVESDEASGWAWRSVPFDDQILVSHMTTIFASEILTAGRCELPTLEESLVSHRFILRELQPHFSRLKEQELTCLPVT